MESVQSALNITDNSIHVGFWFTVKDVEGCHSQMMSALRGKGARGLPKILYGRLRGWWGGGIPKCCGHHL